MGKSCVTYLLTYLRLNPSRLASYNNYTKQYELFILFGIILVLPWYFNTSNSDVFADEFNEIIFPSFPLATVAPRMAWLHQTDNIFRILWYSDWLHNTTSAGNSIFVTNHNTSSLPKKYYATYQTTVEYEKGYMEAYVLMNPIKLGPTGREIITPMLVGQLTRLPFHSGYATGFEAH